MVRHDMSEPTPRERILTTFAHERPDRPPTDGWFHQEVADRLKQHFCTDDWEQVLQQLGMDGWATLSPQLVFPEWERKAFDRPGTDESQSTESAKRTLGTISIRDAWRQGQRSVWLDHDRHVDPWGIQWRVGKGDRYEQWLAGPLQEATHPDDAARYPFPTTDNIREPEDYAGVVRDLKSRGKFVCADFENPFKRAWLLHGLENTLMAYASDRDVLDAIYDRIYPLYTEILRRMAMAGVDMIKVIGDVAMQDRILMGADAWRQVDKPRLGRMVEACRHVNPNVVLFFHSDGKLTDLIDDLIELGFTVINPIQPECMDPIDVSRRWGDRITLYGCISIQRTLPFGSPEDVRREVESLINACGQHGGLVLMPSNVIQPDTRTDNILTCYHTARDHRFASL